MIEQSFAVNTAPLLSVIVPVYKEERNIIPFLDRLIPVLTKIGSYEVIFCLDRSPADRTEEVILEAINQNPHIGLLTFSRRFGQPSATMAGILNCAGEHCVVIDVDMQDPPEIITDLYNKSREGYDVVLAKRRSRKGETAAKLLFTNIGYRIVNFIADVDIPRNSGDFRIMNRRVMEELRRLPEKHGFLRGLVAFVGYRQTAIEYDRDERAFGVGNYNRFLGSMKIAMNGVLGFSTYPLSLMMWGGFGIAMLSAIAALVMIFLKLVLGHNYPMGIPTITVLVLFMGGVQIASIGLLGEYIGRIYEEVRHRPRFIIDGAVNVAVKSRDGRYINKDESPT